MNNQWVQPHPAEVITKNRIAGRSLANDVLGFIPKDASKEFLDSFWRELKRLGPQEEASELLVMTDDKAAEFERQEINFGIHAGKSYREVPIGYLTFLADASVKLQSYLRSDRGVGRIKADQK